MHLAHHGLQSRHHSAVTGMGVCVERWWKGDTRRCGDGREEGMFNLLIPFLPMLVTLALCKRGQMERAGRGKKKQQQNAPNHIFSQLSWWRSYMSVLHLSVFLSLCCLFLDLWLAFFACFNPANMRDRWVWHLLGKIWEPHRLVVACLECQEPLQISTYYINN